MAGLTVNIKDTDVFRELVNVVQSIYEKTEDEKLKFYIEMEMFSIFGILNKED